MAWLVDYGIRATEQASSLWVGFLGKELLRHEQTSHVTRGKPYAVLRSDRVSVERRC
ncbi:MAG: hypothetical protein ACM3ZE_02970 [Myxococcales bacterium]